MTKQQRHRSPRLTFSIDRETRSKIEAAAEREQRPIASMVRVFVAAGLKACSEHQHARAA